MNKSWIYNELVLKVIQFLFKKGRQWLSQIIFQRLGNTSESRCKLISHKKGPQQNTEFD